MGPRDHVRKPNFSHKGMSLIPHPSHRPDVCIPKAIANPTKLWTQGLYCLLAVPAHLTVSFSQSPPLGLPLFLICSKALYLNLSKKKSNIDLFSGFIFLINSVKDILNTTWNNRIFFSSLKKGHTQVFLRNFYIIKAEILSKKHL